MQPTLNKNNTTIQRGLVVSYFGNSVAVEAVDGQVFQCQLHRNQALPVVGDQIKWQMENSETGTVLEIEPRRSLLSRGDARGKLKPLAANVDVMLIVMSPPPIFSEYLVDRYLIAAELLGISAVIVVNKADLMDRAALEVLNTRLKPYRAMQYQVLLTSALTSVGMDELSALFKNKNAVLVGPSGVGKSSIIAKLGHFEKIQIGDVSNKGAGRHTTTATRLYHLPNGGNLIDSPGVREFSLWAVSAEEVLTGYRDIRAHVGKCRFRDCSHLVEPGCAVQVALERGDINPERFKSYQSMIKLKK